MKILQTDKIMNGKDVVIVEGKRYVKAGQLAQRLGVSRATAYRRLHKLQECGVEVVRIKERVTLINEADLERHLAETASKAEEQEKTLRLEILREARHVRALIRERHGSFPNGEAARAVREGRESFGA